MPYQRARTAIGTRRERILIRVAVTSDDGMGGQAVSRYRTVAEPWAAVTALDERDKEALAAQQITARHSYHMDIRYRQGITPAMQVQWRDQTFEIFTVADDDMRKKRLILQVGEVQHAT